jgi:Zn-dependent metalloprotease
MKGDFVMEQHIGCHSIFCVLPPYILRAIAQNGEPEQRRRALQTLSHDHTFRSLRATHRLFSDTHTRSLAWLGMDRTVHRVVYNAHNTTDLPGTVVREEGKDAVTDPAVNEAYDGLGYTHHFYLKNYERNSIDNKGMELDAVVHYGQDYGNAFFNGEYMVFGDGDGDFVDRFTVALDIIGHELTHGVTAHEAGLDYFGQSGALNESISDVFGSLIKQFSLKQTADQADWLIGQGLFKPRVQGCQGQAPALRSMKAPGQAFCDPILGQDPQPAHMNNYVYTVEDDGGVHTNSGIPNVAFYNVAIKIGGFAWERAGRIWYETLRDSRLSPSADFQDFARLTWDNAEKLYGRDSHESKVVQEAWDGVGVHRVLVFASVNP